MEWNKIETRGGPGDDTYAAQLPHGVLLQVVPKGGGATPALEFLPGMRVEDLTGNPPVNPHEPLDPAGLDKSRRAMFDRIRKEDARVNDLTNDQFDLLCKALTDKEAFADMR